MGKKASPFLKDSNKPICPNKISNVYPYVYSKQYKTMISCLRKNNIHKLEIFYVTCMSILKSSYYIEALLEPTGCCCNKFISVVMHLCVSQMLYIKRITKGGQYIYSAYPKQSESATSSPNCIKKTNQNKQQQFLSA